MLQLISVRCDSTSQEQTAKADPDPYYLLSLLLEHKHWLPGKLLPECYLLGDSLFKRFMVYLTCLQALLHWVNHCPYTSVCLTHLLVLLPWATHCLCHCTTTRGSLIASLLRCPTADALELRYITCCRESKEIVSIRGKGQKRRDEKKCNCRRLRRRVGGNGDIGGGRGSDLTLASRGFSEG